MHCKCRGIVAPVVPGSAGQSLIEVILAMAVFGLMTGSIASLVAGSLRGLAQGGDQTAATALAQEGIEAVRSIRDRAWNENVYSQSGVQISGTEWIFLGESTTETIGKFTRTISFADVCRDSMGAIVNCLAPGSYRDIHTKQLTVSIQWVTSTGATNTVEQIAYLTNWDSYEWREDDLTDFSDGVFNFTESSVSLGDGDGSVTLQTQ